MKREKRFWDFERKRIYLNTFRKEIRIEIQNTIRIDFFFFFGFQNFFVFLPSLQRFFFCFVRKRRKSFVGSQSFANVGTYFALVVWDFFCFLFLFSSSPPLFCCFFKRKKIPNMAMRKTPHFLNFLFKVRKRKKECYLCVNPRTFFLLRGCW